MSLNEQIALFASVILALLTLLRIISGITGSRRIKDAILQSTVTTTYFLIFASTTKFLIETHFLKDLLVVNNDYILLIEDILISLWLVLIVYQFGLGVIYRLYVRSIRFKDWGTFSNLKTTSIARFFKWLSRTIKGDKKEYETERVLNANLEETFKIIKKHVNVNITSRRPVLITGNDPWVLRKKIVSFIADLLINTDEEFNYVCCTVSPDSIWILFEEELVDKKKLKKIIIEFH